MAENTSIEWTDRTFNPWEGCTKVSPACLHCYAETLVSTRYQRVKWGKGQPRRRTSAANWLKPLAWNKAAANFRQCTGCGRREQRKWDGMGLTSCSTPGCLALSETESFTVRQRVFCSSLADWLDEEVSIEWLTDLLDLIRRTPNLDWLLLTKRPQSFFDRHQAAMMHAAEHWDKYTDALLVNWLSAWWVPEGCEEGEPHRPPANVWIGTTVEDQARADERIPLLLSIPARVRFLSCEPLLGSVDLNRVSRTVGAAPEEITEEDDTLGPPLGGDDGIDWVICGGESGPGARPMHPEWARSLRNQCQAAGVPFLFKQHGEWFPTFCEAGCPETTVKESFTFPTGQHMWRVGKKAAGRLLDGRTWDEFPTFAALQPANQERAERIPQPRERDDDNDYADWN